jgi:asparaginyl-tRNA synthetase
MPRPETVAEILRSEDTGSRVTVRGWIKTARTGKNVAFAQVSDGSCQGGIQVVFDRSSFSEDDLAGLETGAAVVVSGELVGSPGREQSVEVKAESIEVVGPAGGDYPLQKKRHSLEFLRGIPHLRVRTNTFGAAFRMRHHLSLAIHRFFDERGFFYVHPPLITQSDAEGAGETFQVTTLPLDNVPLRKGEVDFGSDYFRRQAFLSVSAQLEAEPLALALGRVYTFGPTFRADPSDTRVHCAEFWMIEPEMAFFDLTDNIELIEEFVRYTAEYVMERCGDEIAFFDRFIHKGLRKRYDVLLEEGFGRITYTEAVDRLQSSGVDFETQPEWGAGFSSEHERWLAGELFGRPVFVTDYPSSIKPFYMRLGEDGRTVACTDLLVPEVGEIVGGSQREERLDILTARSGELGIDLDRYDWYFDLRRWGSVPHSGFGLGLERLLMYYSGIENIRDVIPFPRTLGRMI